MPLNAQYRKNGCVAVSQTPAPGGDGIADGGPRAHRASTASTASAANTDSTTPRTARSTPVSAYASASSST